MSYRITSNPSQHNVATGAGQMGQYIPGLLDRGNLDLGWYNANPMYRKALDQMIAASNEGWVNPATGMRFDNYAGRTFVGDYWERSKEKIDAAELWMSGGRYDWMNRNKQEEAAAAPAPAPAPPPPTPSVQPTQMDVSGAPAAIGGPPSDGGQAGTPWTTGSGNYNAAGIDTGKALYINQDRNRHGATAWFGRGGPRLKSDSITL